MNAADFSDAELWSEVLRRGVGYRVPDPALGGLDEEIAYQRLVVRAGEPAARPVAAAIDRQLSRAVLVLTGRSLAAA